MGNQTNNEHRQTGTAAIRKREFQRTMAAPVLLARHKEDKDPSEAELLDQTVHS